MCKFTPHHRGIAQPPRSGLQSARLSGPLAERSHPGDDAPQPSPPRGQSLDRSAICKPEAEIIPEGRSAPGQTGRRHSFIRRPKETPRTEPIQHHMRTKPQKPNTRPNRLELAPSAPPAARRQAMRSGAHKEHPDDRRHTRPCGRSPPCCAAHRRSPANRVRERAPVRDSRRALASGRRRITAEPPARASPDRSAIRAPATEITPGGRSLPGHKGRRHSFTPTTRTNPTHRTHPTSHPDHTQKNQTRYRTISTCAAGAPRCAPKGDAQRQTGTSGQNGTSQTMCKLTKHHRGIAQTPTIRIPKHAPVRDPRTALAAGRRRITAKPPARRTTPDRPVICRLETAIIQEGRSLPGHKGRRHSFTPIPEQSPCAERMHHHIRTKPKKPNTRPNRLELAPTAPPAARLEAMRSGTPREHPDMIWDRPSNDGPPRSHGAEGTLSPPSPE